MKTTETCFISDEILVQQYKEGKNEVLADLYNKYFHKVYSKCYSFTRDRIEACDLAQDILLKTFEHIHSFKGESKFSTWLYSITNNHCIEYTRKKHQFRQISLDLIVDLPDCDNLSEEENSESTRIILYKTIDALSLQEKELLYLKYQENYSIKDLQAKLNLSPSAVKMRLKRVRDKVEKVYQRTQAKQLKYWN